MTKSSRQAGQSCLHTHTTFCDGATDVETMCKAAFEKGFSSIGFSSHAPLEKKTGLDTVWHLKDAKLNEYIDTVEKAKKQWQGKLAVFLGLEVDYIKGLIGPGDADIQALPLDYIIGSVHYLFSPKDDSPFNIDTWPEDFNTVIELFDNDGKAFCKAYYDAYNSMIAGGGFDILGHLDLIKKNNERYGFFSCGDNWYKEHLVNTADLITGVRNKAKKTGERLPVVEVNTGAMLRGYISEPYPSSYMMKLLAERQIPLVLNADAHSPDHLGGCYETAEEMMKQAGHSTMVFFEGREDGKAVWRTLAL